jgi:hypothetical protein
VLADGASGSRAQYCVMPRKMSCHSTYSGTLDAALGLGSMRCAEQ